MGYMRFPVVSPLRAIKAYSAIEEYMRQGNKYGIHNSLHNKLHRYVEMVGLRLILESMGLIIEDPQLRTLDTLFMASPCMKPNSWKIFLYRLALDIAITSGLAQAAMEPLSAVTDYAERKRGRNDIRERCVSMNLDKFIIQAPIINLILLACII